MASKRSRGVFRHRWWIAVEAVLLVGLAKDWVSRRVVDSSLPGAGKVLFVMAATIGLLGSLYVVVEAISSRGIDKTHAVAKRLPLSVPTLVFHLVVLAVLFVLYARTLNVSVW